MRRKSQGPDGLERAAGLMVIAEYGLMLGVKEGTDALEKLQALATELGWAEPRPEDLDAWASEVGLYHRSCPRDRDGHWAYQC